MRVIHDDFRNGRKTDVKDVPGVVEANILASHYGEGELERLRSSLQKAAEIIGTLVSILADKDVLTAEQLQNILGYGYEVEQ